MVGAIVLTRVGTIVLTLVGALGLTLVGAIGLMLCWCDWNHAGAIGTDLVGESDLLRSVRTRVGLSVQ